MTSATTTPTTTAITTTITTTLRRSFVDCVERVQFQFLCRVSFIQCKLGFCLVVFHLVVITLNFGSNG